LASKQESEILLCGVENKMTRPGNLFVIYFRRLKSKKGAKSPFNESFTD